MNKKIYIIGLGLNGIEDLTLKSYKKIKEVDKVYLRTKFHPGVEMFEKENISYESFDDLYEKSEDFSTLYTDIANKVLEAPFEKIAYIVPGSSVYAEKSALLIANNEKGIEVEIINGVSFVEGVFSLLKVDALERGYTLIDGLSLDTQQPNPKSYTIICQVYNSFIASDVKLKLLDYYSEDTKIYLINAAGSDKAMIDEISLCHLDRYEKIDYLSTIVIAPVSYLNSLGSMDSFYELLTHLRSEDGCPWDREQTSDSLCAYLIEECYEVVNAVELDDEYELLEELGDVLLNIVMHIIIAKEENKFDLRDVIKEVSEKMINRHPHVFMENKEDIIHSEKLWNDIKDNEKSLKNTKDRLEGIAVSLPSLIYSQKINKKIKENISKEEIIKSILAAVNELSFEENEENLYNSLGDILFKLTKLADILKLNSEEALKKYSKEFIRKV